MDHPHQSLELKPGIPVQIYRGRPSGGNAIEACVKRVDDDALVWLENAGPGFSPGDKTWLDVSVDHDARYRAACEVEVASDAQIALSPRGPSGASDHWRWDRVQQRMLVRVDTENLSVVIRARPGAKLASADQPGETRRMIDLSAGGMRIAAHMEFEIGQTLSCEFELPDQPGYSLLSRVVRIDPERDWVSLQFSNASESIRSSILRWVFREQVRQHHRTLAGE